MTGRVLLAVFLLAATFGLSSKLVGEDRATETEMVFLYHSGTKGEIEECG